MTAAQDGTAKLARLIEFLTTLGIVAVFWLGLDVVGQHYTWISGWMAGISAILIIIALVVAGWLTAEEREGSDDRPGAHVAVLFAVYLVVYQLALVYISIGVWLSSEVDAVPLPGALDNLPAGKIDFFQDLVLAACAAGLGGAVFMVREFYINYCYGRDKIKRTSNDDVTITMTKTKEYLRAEEWPRYFLLPISALILGPVVLCLLTAGKISLGNTTEVSRPVIVVVCFVSGFAYHDTLKFMTDLSQTIFQRKS